MLEFLIITVLTLTPVDVKFSKLQVECRKLEHQLMESAPESVIRRINPYTGEVDLLYVKMSTMFKKPCRRV